MQIRGECYFGQIDEIICLTNPTRDKNEDRCTGGGEGGRHLTSVTSARLVQIAFDGRVSHGLSRKVNAMCSQQITLRA